MTNVSRKNLPNATTHNPMLLEVPFDLQTARGFYLRNLRIDYDYDTHQKQIEIIASQMESKQYAEYLDRIKVSRDISNSVIAISSIATATGSMIGATVTYVAAMPPTPTLSNSAANTWVMNTTPNGGTAAANTATAAFSNTAASAPMTVPKPFTLHYEQHCRAYIHEVVGNRFKALECLKRSLDFGNIESKRRYDILVPMWDFQRTVREANLNNYLPPQSLQDLVVEYYFDEAAEPKGLVFS